MLAIQCFNQHVYPVPQKAGWRKKTSNETVAVYSTVGSGVPQYAMVSRMKAGLKELDPSFRKPLPERYDLVYDAGAWELYLSDYAKNLESRWSELLFFRTDLSS